MSYGWLGESGISVSSVAVDVVGLEVAILDVEDRADPRGCSAAGKPISASTYEIASSSSDAR